MDQFLMRSSVKDEIKQKIESGEINLNQMLNELGSMNQKYSDWFYRHHFHKLIDCVTSHRKDHNFSAGINFVLTGSRSFNELLGQYIVKKTSKIFNKTHRLIDQNDDLRIKMTHIINEINQSSDPSAYLERKNELDELERQQIAIKHSCKKESIDSSMVDQR